MPIEVLNTMIAVAFLTVWAMIGVLSTSYGKAQFVQGADRPDLNPTSLDPAKLN